MTISVDDQLQSLDNMIEVFVHRFGEGDDPDNAEIYAQNLIVRTAMKLFSDLIADRHVLDGEGGFAVHYTSLPRLFDIFEHGGMRLYDSHSVNDPMEGKFFDEHSGFLDKLDWLLPDPSTPSYLASFSISDRNDSRSDRLDYWRLYGDDCRGCSLEFPAERGTFRKVLYGRVEVENTARILLPILHHLAPIEGIAPDASRLLADSIRDALGPLRYLYKSRDYANEFECRLIVLPQEVSPNRLHFDTDGGRTGMGPVRHYCYDERLSLEALFGATGSRITLGPSVRDRAEVCYALKVALRKAEKHGTTINYSQKTYRSS